MLLSISPIKYNNVSSSYPAFGKSRNTKPDGLDDAKKLICAQMKSLNRAIALYDKICRLNTEIERLKIQQAKETNEKKKISLAKTIAKKTNELNKLVKQLEE